MEFADPVETDVAVVGSGGAGLAAAIAAGQGHARVLLVSKSAIGIGNSTAMTSGTFRAALGGLTPAEHYAETVKAGRGLGDPDLVNVLVKEAPQRIMELMEWGAPLTVFKGGVELTGHHIEPSPGKKATSVLVKQAEKLGVCLLDKIMVVDLLVNDGRVVGALALGPTGWIVVKAKAVVLATGGVGGLYPYSTNPQQTTGDGQAMALRARVACRDMEFVQFVPFGVVEPGLARMLIPAEVMDHVPLVNARGDEFLRQHFAAWGVTRPGEVNRYARDYGTLAIWQEIEQGRGDRGAVILRLSAIDPELWKIPEMAYFQRHILREFPIDRDIHVAPLAHFAVGGISISTMGQTSLAGLFAAGEVSGGLHGANRLGGNALSEMLVFGARAGMAAAEYGRGVSFDDSAEQHARRIVTEHENLPGCGHLEITQLRVRIRSAVEKYLGPIRSQPGLEAFLDEASGIRALESELAIRTTRDRQKCLELENMILVSETIARAAQVRQESRGAHYRVDYPEPVDEFASKHTLIGSDGVCRLVASDRAQAR